MHSLIGYPSRISKEPSDASLTFLNKDGTIPPYPHFSTYLGSILAIVKHHLERKIASNVKKENISVSVLRHESSELQWFVLHEKSTVDKD